MVESDSMLEQTMQKIPKSTYKALRQMLQAKNKHYFSYMQEDADFKQMSPG